MIPELSNYILTSNLFFSQGDCYIYHTWNLILVWLHLIGDSAIALAFYSIPLGLIYWARKQKNQPFPPSIWFLSPFFICCGTIYVLEVWAIWQPIYWLTGGVKIITVIIFMVMANQLFPHIPQALSLLNSQHLITFNQQLDRQIDRLKRIDRFTHDLHTQLETRVTERTLELNTLNQKLTQEINERKYVEATLQYQLRLEQLIGRLSSQFINISAEKINDSIREGLQTISNFAGVDRTYLFLFAQPDMLLAHTYQWSNLQSRSVIFPSDKTELEQNIPWVMDKIKYKQIINLPNIDNLPLEASQDQNYLQQQNIKSLLMLPMFYGGSLVGLLGFDSISQQRNWTKGDIQLLRLAGEIFINAIERCRQQQQLILRTQQLESSNQELQQFTHIVSHDLQEPLRAISSYTELLEEEYREQLDAEAREYINFVVGGAQRMKQLIQDLLVFSRVGRQPQNFSLVSCEEVLKEVIANLKIAIDENEAVITWDRLPQVVADKSQLIQLWQNLIANSIKFRSEESPKIHISVTTKEQEFVFCLRDNGIGIDPKHAERIFVIFQRLHTRRTYPGTGIGLAICKKIIERHRGMIWLESVPGSGTAFYFSLPIRNQQSSR
ncbi:MAG: ATP-binding protein [Xenococcaceae cyanobacterium MO_188.B32]|nr:ATP-binding protein [Xenococcaceae cyanobacterium MO_188.B32]